VSEAVEPRIEVENSPTRCPYCHEGIEIAEGLWSACSACLARHHTACWDELGRCASCESVARLGPGALPAAPAPAAGTGSSGRVRRVEPLKGFELVRRAPAPPEQQSAWRFAFAGLALALTLVLVLAFTRRGDGPAAVPPAPVTHAPRPAPPVIDSSLVAPAPPLGRAVTDDGSRAKAPLDLLSGRPLIRAFELSNDWSWTSAYTPRGLCVLLEDGRALTSSGEWPVSLRTVDASTEITTLGDGTEPHPSSFATDPEGKRVAIGCADGTIYVLRSDGSLVTTVQGTRDRVTSVALSPDGLSVVARNGDTAAYPAVPSTITLWDLATRKVRLRAPAQGGAGAIAFSPDGRLLVEGGSEGAVSVRDVEADREVAVLTPPPPPVLFRGSTRVQGLPGRPSTLPEAIGSVHGYVRPRPVLAVGFLRDSRCVIVATRDAIRVWDLTTKEVIRTLLPRVGNGRPEFGLVALAKQGELLAATSDDGALTLWDTVVGERLDWVSQSPHTLVPMLAWAPDGGSLVLGTQGGRGLRFLVHAEASREAVSLLDGLRRDSDELLAGEPLAVADGVRAARTALESGETLPPDEYARIRTFFRRTRPRAALPVLLEAMLRRSDASLWSQTFTLLSGHEVTPGREVDRGLLAFVRDWSERLKPELGTDLAGMGPARRAVILRTLLFGVFRVDLGARRVEPAGVLGPTFFAEDLTPDMVSQAIALAVEPTYRPGCVELLATYTEGRGVGALDAILADRALTPCAGSIAMLARYRSGNEDASELARVLARETERDLRLALVRALVASQGELSLAADILLAVDLGSDDGERGVAHAALRSGRFPRAEAVGKWLRREERTATAGTVTRVLELLRDAADRSARDTVGEFLERRLAAPSTDDATVLPTAIDVFSSNTDDRLPGGPRSRRDVDACRAEAREVVDRWRAKLQDEARPGPR
jgi:WD40 repeat protein